MLKCERKLRENCDQRQSPEYRTVKSMQSFERCSGATTVHSVCVWCVANLSIHRLLWPFCSKVIVCSTNQNNLKQTKRKKNKNKKNWAIFHRTEPLRAAITCHTGAGRQSRYISIAPRSDTVKTSRIAQWDQSCAVVESEKISFNFLEAGSRRTNRFDVNFSWRVWFIRNQYN